MQNTYVENFYDPPRRRYTHNDEIVCAVPSCNCKPEPMPKSYKDKVGVQAGKQLYKAFCPAHTVVYDYTVKGKHKWSSNKKRDGLWCRMPIFYEAMGLDPSELNCNHTKDYMDVQLEKLQELIHYGSPAEALKKAKKLNIRFTNEHIFGSKEYGEQYTVCVCNNCASIKTEEFEDNQAHSEKVKLTTFTNIKNNLTDSILSDKMLIESWTMNEALSAIRGDKN